MASKPASIFENDFGTYGDHSTVVSSDKYTAKSGQVGAVGDGAKIERGIHFHTDIEATTNLKSLALKLNSLWELMKEESKSVEQDAIIGIIAKAEMSALKGDPIETLSFLCEAGKWPLELSQKVGLNNVTKAIKIAIGI